MIDQALSLGSTIGIDIITERVRRKLDAFKEKKEIEQFTQHLKEWEIDFERTHDGSIVTSEAFYSHFVNFRILEKTVEYILGPNTELITEGKFIDEVLSILTENIEQDTGNKLSVTDASILKEFMHDLIFSTKTFLLGKVSFENRGILYLICQNQSEIKKISNDIEKRFHLQESQIKSIIEKIDSIVKSIDTEDAIKEKIISWNSRQICSLGDRYSPKVNIPIEISNVLYGAAITRGFAVGFINEADTFLTGMRNSGIKEIEENCKTISKLLSGLDIFHISSEHVNLLRKKLDTIEGLLNNRYEEYFKEADANRKSVLDDKTYRLHRRLSLLSNFRDYLESDEINAATSPYVLLAGDGGTGKSHLIADFIESQTNSGMCSLLILGQQITSGKNVISELPAFLGCDMTYHDLFETLESIACSQRNRVVICIDALNEGAGVNYWNRSLAELVEFLKNFPHIGLVVSVRTQYEPYLFKDQSDLQKSLIRLQHNGFSTVTHDAVYKYFDFYGITTDSVVLPDSEFSNPLFLRVFCMANKGCHVSLNNVSLPDVYAKYIDEIERKVAESFGCNKAYKLVRKTMDRITSARIYDGLGAVKLTIDSVIRIISEICREWNLSGDLYTALLNEGVLTQGIDYDDSEYVYITYERLEDYFLADRIVDSYGQLSEEEFIQKYSWVMNRPDLLQYVGIIFAEQKNKELCDVFSVDDEMKKYQVRNAFLYGLLWRNTNSVTDRTIEYINSEIFIYQHSFEQFIDILFATSARFEHRFNALKSFGFFEREKMPDRDSEFVPIFDKLYYDQDSALYRLMEWGCFYSDSQHIDEYTAECYATILCWLLISPNNILRDRSTKAIRRILESHIEALMAVMKRFEDIDDPYILERIYAVAFGCVIEEKDLQKVQKLAQYVCVNVFDKEEVYPNILLRTYAKNIIDYAQYIGYLNMDDLCVDKITPPYNSKFPYIPTDEEIEKYRIGYNSPGFKDYYWSQDTILGSMEVDSSRDGYGGGNGDFGRYVFQYYFAAWPQLNPIDLKNIAIKKIFDLGYDVEKHGKYDRHCNNHVVIGNQHGKRERIGKKYQWIALYDLAARVSDNFTRSVEDGNWETHQEYCKGSFDPDIRNIDPTIMAFSHVLSDGNNIVEYSIPDITFEEWLDNFELPPIPTFEQCVKVNYDGHEFFLIAGGYEWSDEKKLGYDSYEFPRKRLWHLINAYIVKYEHSESLLSSLDGVDFMGRWMPEAHDESSMYNKEYYWSDADKFFKTPFYCGEDWVDIDFRDRDINFPEKVLVPVKRYFSERRGDINIMPEDVSALSWYKPCEEIFSKLGLQYKCNSNSVFVDKQGELVCFDSSELLGQDIGFYIRQDKLSEFLQDNGYSLIWTSLCEKEIVSENRKCWNLPPKALHRSAVYQFRDGTVKKISENVVEDKLYC